MAPSKARLVNNAIYDQYGERWYTATNDPVALLRAEARARNRWIAARLERRFAHARIRILDIGCGGGFLTNELARLGFRVTGLDASASSLLVARRHDSTGVAGYCSGDACGLAFQNGTFDVVCAMDLLEHVEKPSLVVREAARVLKPGGLFFFYTFNRNPVAWLVVIKGVEWFVRNTPRDMHQLRYFIKPAELSRMCRDNGLDIAEWKGLAPKIFHTSFWKMLATGIVNDDFAFKFTRHLIAGYIGMSVRR